MKEFQKANQILKDNFITNKYPQSRRPILHENIKIPNQIPKKNLPELKLSKLKLRPGSDPELDHKDKPKISNKTGLNYAPFVPKVHKNHNLIKRAELMFPKIKNATNANFFEQQDKNNIVITNYNKNTIGIRSNKFSSKRKNIHSKRSDKIKTLYGTYGINAKYINNINNNNMNSNSIPNRLNYNEKVNDIEKSNVDNINNSNGDLHMINLHKIKSKIPKYSKANKSLPSKGTKIKKNKRDLNFKDSLTIRPLINFPKTNNLINQNNYLKNTSNNKDTNDTNINLTELNLKNNTLSNNNININNNTINILPRANAQSDLLNSFKPTPTSLPTTNSFPESELFQRYSIITSLLNSLSLLTGESNPLFDINRTQKTVELSPEILKNTYKNFIPSVTSSPEEFTTDDIIKGYAYNSSMGNIRDYNEDTISASKIILDGQNDKNTFFFAVYDGHGGNGCSLYLKENLHNFIKYFSKESINEAINTVEQNFLKNEALTENGEVKDQSGSCGIMALIQQNKLIIANVGDSRLVIFKKSTLFFSTEDHKPGSPTEKLRIENAGGKIYQTPTLIPLYQNGKEIDIPWRVFPGRLSVSRTFGDVEAKNESLGGMKNVVVALPDITEIELDEDFNFIVLGCDGIFDVLSNEEILECVKIVLKEKEIKDFKNINMSQLCGDIAEMIVKSSLAKDSFDNVSCIVVAINLNELIN